MSSASLDCKTLAKLEQLFPKEQRTAAAALLETHCGTGPPLVTAQGLEGIERIRCAVLKISEGSLEKLHAAVQHANNDWRDVLVAAGFANNVLAHLSWLEGEKHA